MKGAPKEDNNSRNIQELSKNKGEYFSFIVFGDNHSGLIFNDASAMKLIWHMNREDRFRKEPVDFVLSAGDLTWDGKERHFKDSKKIQKLIKWPLIAAIGNHDDIARFKEYYGEKEFTFSNRNSFFIVLDNEAGQLTDDQFKWFEEKLNEASKYENIFVALHKPPFDPYQQEWYNMDTAPWAYKFRKMCAKYAVNMVFSGHKHMFKHEVFDGVHNIVTGGGGMLLEIPEADGGYLHYVRVHVNHDYVTYEVRKVSPPLWEYVVYYVWKEFVYKIRNLYGSGYIFSRNTKHLQPRTKEINTENYWQINGKVQNIL